MKNIYVASSFSRLEHVRKFAEKIRFYGHHVYCFCDEKEPTFRLGVKIRESRLVTRVNHKTALLQPDIHIIGIINWQQLMKADIVVVMLPCGKSAHLEAGWAVGQGKKVLVFGHLPLGEFDAMYVMVDGVYDECQFDHLMTAIGHE